MEDKETHSNQATRRKGNCSSGVMDIMFVSSGLAGFTVVGKEIGFYGLRVNG